jgi:hypothetical protein
MPAPKQRQLVCSMKTVDEKIKHHDAAEVF